MKLVFDLETNGLLDTVNTIHSLVLRDLDTGSLILSCSDAEGADNYNPIQDGLDVMAQADELWGHNIQSYDLPVLQKLHPEWKTNAVIRDTLIMARLRWAHIKDTDYALVKKGRLPGQMVGRHSLEAWGYRLNAFKGSYGKQENAWDKWSPEMQSYCERDTDVTVLLAKTLQKAGYTEQSVEIEHRLRLFLDRMEENGWPFNEDSAVTLMAHLADRREKLGNQLREAFEPWYVSQGERNPKRPNKNKGILAGCPYTAIKLVEFNPTSRAHILNRLKALYKWEPTERTETDQPKLDDDTIKGLPFKEAPLLAEYLLVAKRLGQVSEGKEAWLGQTKVHPLTGMPHIHGRINAGGTVTHRASHSKPNLGQVPSGSAEYGKDCRALFVVPNGWTMLGSDASGLELRCLAHYMAKYDEGEYGKVILEGRNEDKTDIHSVNQRAADLETRNQAKTFIYAFLYGAGDVKLGSIVSPLASEEEQRKIGARLRKRFLKNIPALGHLVEAVQSAARAKGYLLLPDKRRVYVRSQHAALNSLLQGAGAIICKAWICEFDRRMTERFGPQGWEGKWAALGWIHDELQIAVRKDIAEEAAQIAVESIRSITQLFQWRIPLDGEAKLGSTWADTH